MFALIDGVRFKTCTH